MRANGERTRNGWTRTVPPEPGDLVPSGLERREELARDVKRARRTDRDEARLRGDANPRERGEAERDPVCELCVREDEHALDAGRAGGAEDPELVEVRRAGVCLVEERLQIGVAQPLVRDDTGEVLHQKRLRKGRKRIERALRCVGTQRLPVVRGVCDRVRTSSWSRSR
jgi:hypothetical protein